MLREIALPLGALVASCALTGWQRRQALRIGMLDVPNERSSHSRPTPRGGGLAIVVVTLCAALVSWGLDALNTKLLTVIFTSGGAVALVGYVDDRRSVDALPRFTVHVTAAAWSVFHLGGPELGMTIFPALGLVLGSAVLVLGIAWAINAFNFMDGIDGIAASELVFLCAAAALLIWLQGTVATETTYLLCVVAAGAGFLYWNWSPAKIFMGDVGSGFIGFLVGVLALHTHVVGALSIWTWVVLAGVFIADATVTVLRRVLRRERWHEAHRSHAYQRISRRWRSHSKVVIAMLAINFSLLLPAAYWCQHELQYAPYIASAVLAVLGLLCVVCGAGEPESTSSGSNPKCDTDSHQRSPC